MITFKMIATNTIICCMFSFNLTGCTSSDSVSNNLKICTINGNTDMGYYYNLTMQNLIDAPQVEITDKYKNKIATFHDNRGNPVMDYIMQKVEIVEHASCYVVLDLFIYQENKTVPKNSISVFFEQNYGEPTDTFLLDDIKL